MYYIETSNNVICIDFIKLIENVYGKIEINFRTGK